MIWNLSVKKTNLKIRAKSGFLFRISPCTKKAPTSRHAGKLQAAACTLFIKDQEYENGYFTSYDLIRFGEIAIRNVETPEACQRICRLTNTGTGSTLRLVEFRFRLNQTISQYKGEEGCNYWTWQEGNNCYLVSKPNSLEYDDDKISGSRMCYQTQNGSCQTSSHDSYDPNEFDSSYNYY